MQDEHAAVEKVHARVYGKGLDFWSPIEVVEKMPGCHVVVSQPDPATHLKEGDLVRCVEKPATGGSTCIVQCQVLPGGVELYRIDGSVITTERDFHDEVADSLGFFGGYGMNLDALWDVLTDDSGMKWAQEPFHVLWLDSLRCRRSLERFGSIVELFRSVRALPRQIELILDEGAV